MGELGERELGHVPLAKSREPEEDLLDRKPQAGELHPFDRHVSREEVPHLIGVVDRERDWEGCHRNLRL